MTKVLLAVLTAMTIFLTSPSNARADDGAATEGLPPVAQELVREGDFALALAPALGLGDPRGEAEAEETLARAGIAPRNGWISDYPVTPSVVGDIRAAVRKAAAEGRITLDMEAADKAVVALADEYGLPAVAGLTGGPRPDAGPDEGAVTTYYDETTVNNYYYDNGPPVVTYYTPPYYYGYLYDYVYDPFYYGRYYFPGYYILQNFTVVVDGGRHRHGYRHGRRDGRAGWTDGTGRARGPVVTNKVVNPSTGEASVVDPASQQVVDRATERSRREARRAERAARGLAAGTDAGRDGFRPGRERSGSASGTSPSAVVGRTPAPDAGEPGIRALRDDMERGRAARSGRPGTLSGRPETGSGTAATTTGGLTAPSRAAESRERHPRDSFGDGQDQGILPARAPSEGRGDRPMSVRGWTYGTTGEGRPSGASERPSDRSRASSSDSGRPRDGRGIGADTGFAGRGRTSEPGTGGFSSGMPSASAAPSQPAPAPSRGFSADNQPSRDPGVRSAPASGGGDRSFGRQGHGGDNGRGGFSVRENGKGHGDGRRGVGGSCRGKNC